MKGINKTPFLIHKVFNIYCRQHMNFHSLANVSLYIVFIQKNFQALQSVTATIHKEPTDLDGSEGNKMNIKLEGTLTTVQQWSLKIDWLHLLSFS